MKIEITIKGPKSAIDILGNVSYEIFSNLLDKETKLSQEPDPEKIYITKEVRETAELEIKLEEV